MSITGITKLEAAFYDDRGIELGKKSFKSTDKTIEFLDRRFNVKLKEASYTQFRRWYWNKEVYHYNINNPDPLNFEKTVKPIMNSDLYNILFKTQVARQINTPTKDPWYKNISLGMVMLGVAIIGIAIWAINGGLKPHA